ncbi:hypothetical protein B0H19DRAFT_1269901 [Mycena capillaripes]|nr:hypothetical protein B0H19DRAFT_1269901 [Mycena capillaripes]
MADLFETPFSVVSRSGAAGSGVSTTSHSYGLDTVPENPSEHLANDSVSSPTLPVSQPNTSSENPSAASSTPGSPALESNTTSEHLATDDLSSLGSSVEDFSDGRSPLAAALTETPPSKPEAESSVDLDQDAQEVAGVAESATLSFSAGLYASNALSAVSGLLWDPPTFSISHSTPLPDVAPFLSNLQTTLTLGRDSLQPYPDLFDFSMYTRRISRESFCEVIELPSFSVDEPSEKTRPVSIYDVVHERDRYRSAAYSSCISSPVRTSSSPRRPPFSSTLNLDSGRDASAFSHVIAEKSDADGTPTGNDMGGQFMMMCDKLSRCEWTEEEFLKLFASSGTV